MSAVAKIVTNQMIADAKKTIAYGEPRAVGYRLLVRIVYTGVEMEIAEQEKYPTLAKSEFQSKTQEQADRLSKGSYFGILIEMGDFAYATELLGEKPWVKVGDILIFDRYAGAEIELPPGSGEFYRMINDESILGKMEAKP